MIQVHHLQKSFGAIPAVRDVSFLAPDGAITGLLGANGAGKSTSLRLICGVLQADRGTVHVDGETGALLDHTGLYARLTTREHLEYFARLRGIDTPSAIDNTIDLLGLHTIAHRRIAGFSQGERMKVALGCAVVHSPRNLLLDEPTNGLDVPSVRALRALLQRLRNDGACIVFSSHVLEEVRALCDRVVILANGAVAAEGTPDDLCRLTGADSLEDAFVTLTNTNQPETLSC